MPRTSPRKHFPSKSANRKRRPLLLKSIIRNLLDQRRNHTNRIKQIDDQIIETLRSDHTTPAHVWLEIIQIALHRSSVDFETTRLEYSNSGQVPIVIAQKDKLNLIESLTQVDTPPTNLVASQSVVSIITDSCDSPQLINPPSESVEINTTSASILPIEEHNQVENAVDSSEWNSLDCHESVSSDSFLQHLDLTPTHADLISSNSECYFNTLSDNYIESNTLREYTTL